MRRTIKLIGIVVLFFGIIANVYGQNYNRQGNDGIWVGTSGNNILQLTLVNGRFLLTVNGIPNARGSYITTATPGQVVGSSGGGEIVFIIEVAYKNNEWVIESSTFRNPYRFATSNTPRDHALLTINNFFNFGNVIFYRSGT